MSYSKSSLSLLNVSAQAVYPPTGGAQSIAIIWPRKSQKQKLDISMKYVKNPVTSCRGAWGIMLLHDGTKCYDNNYTYYAIDMVTLKQLSEIIDSDRVQALIGNSV